MILEHRWLGHVDKNLRNKGFAKFKSNNLARLRSIWQLWNGSRACLPRASDSASQKRQRAARLGAAILLKQVHKQRNWRNSPYWGRVLSRPWFWMAFCEASFSGQWSNMMSPDESGYLILPKLQACPVFWKMMTRWWWGDGLSKRQLQAAACDAGKPCQPEYLLCHSMPLNSVADKGFHWISKIPGQLVLEQRQHDTSMYFTGSVSCIEKPLFSSVLHTLGTFKPSNLACKRRHSFDGRKPPAAVDFPRTWRRKGLLKRELSKKISFFGRQKPCSDFLLHVNPDSFKTPSMRSTTPHWLGWSPQEAKKEQKRKKIQKDGKSWCKTVESYVANK